jgi:uncharacterized protein YndB with AHSA1/START domain
MIWIAYLAGGLVGLVLLVALVGLALPRGHTATRSAVIAAPRAAVWAALVDVDAYPRWRRKLPRVERRGATRFVEHGKDGAIAYEVVEERAPERRVTRIADDKLPFGGTWTYELAPEGDGTRLTITEDGFVKNPVFRFLARTVFSTAATLEHVLVDLAAHVGAGAGAGATSPRSSSRPSDSASS